MNKCFDQTCDKIKLKELQKPASMRSPIVEAMDEHIFAKAKEAVIEKYISYCKSDFIDRIMHWRMKCFHLTKAEQKELRLKLNLKSKMPQSAVPKVEHIFPLLDPELTLEDAI